MVPGGCPRGGSQGGPREVSRHPGEGQRVSSDKNWPGLVSLIEGAVRFGHLYVVKCGQIMTKRDQILISFLDPSKIERR